MKRSEISKVINEKKEAIRASKSVKVNTASISRQAEQTCPETGKLVFSGVEFIQPYGGHVHNIGDWAVELFYNDPTEDGLVTNPAIIAAINKTMQAIRINRPLLYSSYQIGDEDRNEIANTFVRQYYFNEFRNYESLILILADSPLPSPGEAIVFMDKNEDGTWSYTFEFIELD